MPAGWGLCGPDVEVKGDCDAWGHMWLRPGDLRLTTCAGSSSTIHYATRATPSLSSYATWVSRCSTYRIAGWSTASSGSTMSLRRQPRPAVIFLIGSATSPTERAPLNDRERH